MQSSKNQKLKQLTIDNFACKISQELYSERIQKGLLNYEEAFVKKYFNKNEVILDLGCGTGRTSLALAKLGYQKIIAIDIVVEFINIAKKNAIHKNIDYQVGDATKLSFENAIFQNVFFSYNGWSHIPSKKERLKAFKEIHRVLKKDGTFYFSAMFFKKTPFMFYKWLKFKIANILHIPIWETDFGDVMFYRYNDFREKYIYRFRKKNEQEEMKIYMYFHPSYNQLLKQLEELGFKTLETKKTFVSWDAYQLQIICKKT